MKLKHLIGSAPDEGKVIAQFGGAALIRRTDGKWLLEGGSREDRLTAKEWISLFMHEVLLSAQRNEGSRLRA